VSEPSAPFFWNNPPFFRWFKNRTPLPSLYILCKQLIYHYLFLTRWLARELLYVNSQEKLMSHRAKHLIAITAAAVFINRWIEQE
jgi:hypothetical protein